MKKGGMPFSAKDGVIVYISSEANEGVSRVTYTFFGGYGNAMKV